MCKAYILLNESKEHLNNGGIHSRYGLEESI